jgi:hypothetical protein
MNESGGWVRRCSNWHLQAQNITKVGIRRFTIACIIRRVFSQRSFGVVDLTIALVFAYGVCYQACNSQAVDDAPLLPPSTESCYWRISFVRFDGSCLLVHELCTSLPMS